MIAFRFLGGLRRLRVLRDSRALDSEILGFLILCIDFSTLIQNRRTLLIGALVRETTECLVLAILTFEKNYLIFSRTRVV